MNGNLQKAEKTRGWSDNECVGVENLDDHQPTQQPNIGSNACLGSARIGFLDNLEGSWFESTLAILEFIFRGFLESQFVTSEVKGWTQN